MTRLSPGDYTSVLFVSLGNRNPVFHKLLYVGIAGDHLHRLVRPACWASGQTREDFNGAKTLQRVYAESFGRPCKRCFPAGAEA